MKNIICFQMMFCHSWWYFNNLMLCYLSAIHQDEDDGLDDNHVRSPFGSSFRTFDGTDYSSIGNCAHLHAVLILVLFVDDVSEPDILYIAWKSAVSLW